MATPTASRGALLACSGASAGGAWGARGVSASLEEEGASDALGTPAGTPAGASGASGAAGSAGAAGAPGIGPGPEAADSELDPEEPEASVTGAAGLATGAAGLATSGEAGEPTEPAAPGDPGEPLLGTSAASAPGAFEELDDPALTGAGTPPVPG